MPVVALNPRQTFDDFWKAYPHPGNRGSKKDARKLFATLDAAMVIEGARLYAKWCGKPDQDWYHAQMATTWLRGEGWEGWIEQGDPDKVDEMKYRPPTAEETEVYKLAFQPVPKWVSRDNPIPLFIKDRARR